mmetsp:Transcript_35869/g.78530  ORF Transcript_35869/g.78530 Transcript_35869/m.78530 type:complete len:360 (+) Transcript_35869:85-1164(+)
MSSGQRAVVTRCVEAAEVVNCHAFSPDESILAVCPNNEEIHIFEAQTPGGELRRAHILKQHTQRVTALAWSCNGKLASVSEDRTASVWERAANSGGWNAVLVELKATRAALCVAWAPEGTRFVVGFSSCDVAICSFKEQAQCWVATKVGKSKDAVAAVAWHPKLDILATGSVDGCCTVYQMDQNIRESKVAEILAADAWVNAVAFSPSGRTLAFASQDSSVRFKDLGGSREAPATVVRWSRLPFLQVVFSSERCLIAAGFDNIPVIFRLTATSRWEAVGFVDASPRAGITGSKSKVPRGSFEGAREHFRNMGSREQQMIQAGASSWHSNTITCLAVLSKARFSTSAVDGQVITWELELE